MGTNPSGILPDNTWISPLLTGIKVLKQAEHLMASRITLLSPQLAAPPLHGKKIQVILIFLSFPAAASPCLQNSPRGKSLLKKHGEKLIFLEETTYLWFFCFFFFALFFFYTGDEIQCKNSSFLLGLLREVNDELRSHAVAAGLGQSHRLEKSKYSLFFSS